MAFPAAAFGCSALHFDANVGANQALRRGTGHDLGLMFVAAALLGGARAVLVGANQVLRRGLPLLQPGLVTVRAKLLLQLPLVPQGVLAAEVAGLANYHVLVLCADILGCVRFALLLLDLLRLAEENMRVLQAVSADVELGSVVGRFLETVGGRAGAAAAASGAASDIAAGWN